MISFLDYIDICESKRVGNDQLYFIGTQMHSLKSPDSFTKESVVSLNRLTADLPVDASVYMTKNFEYAKIYAENNGTDDDPAIIIALQLPAGTTFFDVADQTDYTVLFDGIPEGVDIADIFRECEPYFAMNSQLGSAQLQTNVPPEYSAAAMVLRQRSTDKQNSLIENVLKPTTDFSPVSQSDYNSLQAKHAVWTVKQMVQKAGQQALLAQHPEFKTVDEILNSVPDLDLQSLVDTTDKDRFDAKGTYLQYGFVPSLGADTTLQSNYKSIYAEEKVQKTVSLAKVNAYLYLFSRLAEYYHQKTNDGSPEFTQMMSRLTTRIKNKRNGEKHIYVDVLQAVFFTMVYEKGYSGIFAPEHKGVLGILNKKEDDSFKGVFGYGVNGPRPDTTVALFRDVPIVDLFWHTLEQINKIPGPKTTTKKDANGNDVEITVDKQQDFLQVVSRIHTVAKYRRYLQTIVEPHLNANPYKHSDKLKRRADARRQRWIQALKTTHTFTVRLTGKLHKIHTAGKWKGKWNEARWQDVTDRGIQGKNADGSVGPMLVVGIDNVISKVTDWLKKNNIAAAITKIVAVDTADGRQYVLHDVSRHSAMNINRDLRKSYYSTAEF